MPGRPRTIIISLFRDEQINAQRCEIEKKDQVIAEMKVKIVASEAKIDELLKKMKTFKRGPTVTVCGWLEVHLTQQ